MPIDGHPIHISTNSAVHSRVPCTAGNQRGNLLITSPMP